MEILDKKSNRMSRANSGVFEHSEFPDLQRILDFLSLRNLLSNELFFTFCEFATASFLFYQSKSTEAPIEIAEALFEVDEVENFVLTLNLSVGA